MTTRIAALIMTALLALYLVFVVQYAIVMMTSGNPIALALGIALILLPIVGAWALVAEVVFVVRAQRLVGRLGADGGLPVDDLPRLPSGRIDPVAADEQFPAFKLEVEREPQSWRAWLRLGLAYDASGDLRRARWATRCAIELSKNDRTSSL